MLNLKNKVWGFFNVKFFVSLQYSNYFNCLILSCLECEYFFYKWNQSIWSHKKSGNLRFDITRELSMMSDDVAN